LKRGTYHRHTSGAFKGLEKTTAIPRKDQAMFMQSRSIAVLTAIAFATSSVLPGGTLRAQGAPPEAEKAYQQATAAFARLDTALRILDRHIDRSAFDIDALAEKLGRDPATIFNFVRDEIGYEPYFGRLRGASGVLIGRSGNSLDRSLLLAALLSKAGHTTMVAAGTLGDDAATRLAARILEPRKTVSAPAADQRNVLKELAAALGANFDEALAREAKLKTQRSAADRSFAEAAEAHSTHLSGILSRAGIELAKPLLPQDLAPTAREHFWVRYQDSTGVWIDLDPSLADAKPGVGLTALVEQFKTDAVPDRLQHKIGIRVMMRVAKGGGEEDIALMDQMFPVADRHGVSITVANIPHPDISPGPIGTGGSLADKIGTIEEFVPVLQVGGQIVAGRSFDPTGRVYNNPPGSDAGNAERLGKATGGGFGGAGSVLGGILGGTKSPPAQSRIAAFWAEYRLVAPAGGGAAPAIRTYRRDLVKSVEAASLSAPALRARLAWSVELLPTTVDIPPDYLGALQVRALQTMRPQLERQIARLLGRAVDGAPPNVEPMPPLSAMLLSVAASERFRQDASVRHPGVLRFVDRAGLLAFENQINVDGGSLPVFTQGYDIVASGARLVQTDARSSGAERAYLTLGVLETQMEDFLSEARLRAVGDAYPQSARRSAAMALAAARASGAEMVLLRPGSDSSAALAKLDLPAVMKADIAVGLAAGDTIVVPSRPIDVAGRPSGAWWRISADRTELVGMLEGGRGNALAEWVSKNFEWLIYWTAIYQNLILVCAYKAGRDKGGYTEFAKCSFGMSMAAAGALPNIGAAGPLLLLLAGGYFVLF
jgi:hypothetical protein